MGPNCLCLGLSQVKACSGSWTVSLVEDPCFLNEGLDPGGAPTKTERGKHTPRQDLYTQVSLKVLWGRVNLGCTVFIQSPKLSRAPHQAQLHRICNQTFTPWLV